MSVKCELICARGPRLVVSVTLQHADHSTANEQQETCTMLQAGKLCTDITDRGVCQIAPDRCVWRNDEVGKEASTGEPPFGDGRVRQLLPNRIERLASLVEEHIHDCLFEWREHGRAA